MRTELESVGTIAIERSKLADYITLTKPELTFLSVLTALGGFYLGSEGTLSVSGLLHTLLGTALVGGGAGALNQFIERDYDRMMRRTENRPLPSGRLLPVEALLFGTILSLAGVIELTLFTNVLTGFLAVATLVTYLFLYTPLKRISWISTSVGGIPGALPPLIGWTAARNDLTGEGWILFAILFFWQMPHFFSLAWMYRKDYERAGYPMLAVLDQEGRRTATQIIFYAGGLIPVSMLLTILGGSGWIYFAGAAIAGLAFLYCGVELFRTRSNASARRMFFASLIYLPVLLALMVIDKI